MKWFASILLVVGIISMVVPGVFARSQNGDHEGKTIITRQFLVGTGVLCTLGVPNACPDVAMASNGDVVSVDGKGTFTVRDDKAREVSGSGTFTHKNSEGDVLGTGTWTATELVSFVSYGTDGGTTPANFEGGLAVIEVHLAPTGGGEGFDATLNLSCVIGHPPTGADEGITLAVEEGPNFNHSVSGITLFILQSTPDD